MQEIILDRGLIDAPRRPFPPLLSLRGVVLIASGLLCAAFWCGVGYLIAR